MTGPLRRHRLDGLEPDNLLAFLALLGLLRALEDARPDWRPKAAWGLDEPPLRPVLVLAQTESREAVCEVAAEGVARLLAAVDFGTVSDLKLDAAVARSLGEKASRRTDTPGRYFAALCAALVCDIAVDKERSKVEPTPLVYPSVATSNFLKNFRELCKADLPEKDGRGRDSTYPKDAAGCIEQALFAPWQRRDRPVGLRWDPDEAKRHAYQWRAPTKDPPTTQHGANRLAIVGLSALTAAPVVVRHRIELAVVGGEGGGDRFSLAWPIWRAPASLAAIRALLSHPDLRSRRALAHLGVDHVRVARRISLDRLRNFTRAEPLLDP
jgi:hypothetical protein